MFCLILNQNSSGIQPADRKCTQQMLSVPELDGEEAAESHSASLCPTLFFVLILIYVQMSLVLQMPYESNPYSYE